MKNLIQKRWGLFLVISILSLIALSSCLSRNKVDTDSSPSVSVASAEDPNLSDEVKHMLANQDKLNLLVAKGDVKECGTLDMPQYRLSCEANILANRAKSKADVAVCATASTSEIKAQCESLFLPKKL